MLGLEADIQHNNNNGKCYGFDEWKCLKTQNNPSLNFKKLENRENVVSKLNFRTQKKITNGIQITVNVST